MAKPSEKNRSMQPENGEAGELFFFPKHTPPVSIRAASREEAEAILEANDKEA